MINNIKPLISDNSNTKPLRPFYNMKDTVDYVIKHTYILNKLRRKLEKDKHVD